MTTLASRTLETLNVRLHRDAFLYVISSNRVEINNFATVDCRSECTLKCSVGGIPVRLKQYSELVLKLGVFFYIAATLLQRLLINFPVNLGRECATIHSISTKR